MLQRNTIPQTPRPVAVNGMWRLVVVALVVSFAIVLFDLADGALYFGDADDVLRALQIRELLRSGDWFDRTLPFISMPEPYVSPWSRLVDLPYAVLAKGLAPLVGDEAGLKAAFLIWPPIMLVGYCLLVVAIVQQMLPEGKVLETPALVATMLAMALSIWEFSPGRIDHHNVQLLTILCIFWGLITWTRWGAIVSGVAVLGSNSCRWSHSCWRRSPAPGYSGAQAVRPSISYSV
jgi:hypothetical protein